MANLWWRIRAAWWLWRLTDMGIGHCMDVADMMEGTYLREGYTPEEAAREELSYWGE